MSLAIVTVLLTLFSLGAYVVAASTHRLARPDPPPPAAATRDGRWVQDIEYLASQLPRLHKNGIVSVSNADFQRQARVLASRVPSLTDVQITRELMHLTTLLHDGETGVNVRGTGRFGFNILRIEGHIRVSVVPRAYKEALGAELLAIDGHSMEQITRAMGYVDSAVTDWELNSKLIFDLHSAPMLAAAGVSAAPDRVTLTVRTMAGTTRSLRFRLGQFASLSDYVSLPQTLATSRFEPYWSYHDASKMLVYLRYQQCLPDQGFQRLAREAVNVLLHDPKQRLVVDLRGNPGGNSHPFDTLVEQLRKHPQLARSRRVMGLIDPGVFSSGTLSAARLHEQAGVRLVGEPTADPVNQYGDWRTFTLPNSRIVVRYSTKYFDPFPPFRGDPYVSPDITAAPALADVLKGRDPVLDAALANMNATAS